jgi:hypothetical protein
VLKLWAVAVFRRFPKFDSLTTPFPWLTYKIIDFEAPVEEAESDWVVDEELLETPTWP